LAGRRFGFGARRFPRPQPAANGRDPFGVHGQSPHTVRGLAAELRVSKPAITRALDRLEELELIKRLPDERDKRSILVGRTIAGSVYLREMADRITMAAAVTER